MTIYQKELLRRLPYYGCIGRYSENEEALSLIYNGTKYNGTKIGWMEKEGSVYAMVDDNMPEDADEVFSAVRNQAKEICEYARHYDASPAMGIPSMEEYRRLAEYGDVVLGGLYSEQHGFMFPTRKMNKDRNSAFWGHYTPDYETAKQDFAVWAGLLDKDRVFTEDEAANLYRCVDYTRDNCETLTYEQERQLEALAEKIRHGYPRLKESPPSFEQGDSQQLNL